MERMKTDVPAATRATCRPFGVHPGFYQGGLSFKDRMWGVGVYFNFNFKIKSKIKSYPVAKPGPAFHALKSPSHPLPLMHPPPYAATPTLRSAGTRPPTLPAPTPYAATPTLRSAGTQPPTLHAPTPYAAPPTLRLAGTWPPTLYAPTPYAATPRPLPRTYIDHPAPHLPRT